MLKIEGKMEQRVPQRSYKCLPIEKIKQGGQPWADVEYKTSVLCNKKGKFLTTFLKKKSIKYFNTSILNPFSRVLQGKKTLIDFFKAWFIIQRLEAIFV